RRGERRGRSAIPRRRSGTDHPGRDRPPRRVQRRRDARAPVCLRRRFGQPVSTPQLCSERGRLHGHPRQPGDARLVRGPPRGGTDQLVALPPAGAGPQRGGRAGIAGARVVVVGGAGDRPAAGRSQSGQGGADEPARESGRQLALALHRRDDVRAGLGLTEEFDPRLGPRRRVDRGDAMKATQTLHERGQSLWLDNITRDLLESGTLARYIDELSVTGLTSNPTIFDHAIKNSSAYDAAIRKKVREGKSGEDLFFELAL